MYYASIHLFQIYYQVLLMFGHRFFCGALRGTIRVTWGYQEAFSRGEDRQGHITLPWSSGVFE